MMERFAFGILCAVASVIFAAGAVDRLRSSGLAVFGFVVACFILARGYRVDDSAVASAVGLIALLVLLRPAMQPLALGGAGILTAAWTWQLHELGLPLALAAVIAAAPVAAALVLATRRRRFAPLELREEALAGVAAAAFLVALLPGLLAGWRSARVLNVEGIAGSPSTAAWVVVALLAPLATGAAFAFHRRRS